MTLIIVFIILLGFLLIATESITKINKAASAIFAGTLGWVLYICYGTDFVTNLYPREYDEFLGGAMHTGSMVKLFISQSIFLPHVGRAAEIVLFLLATMTIVEILNNNGCFDFITPLLKTRNSKKMLWSLSTITFLLSANLDNLTTSVMMLTIMHRIVPNRKQRMILGAAIIIAANCGGAMTVIGDPAGLFLWNLEAVTATSFSMTLFIPCLIACGIPIYLLGRLLPERVETEWIPMPYRGEDTRFNVWQRLVMLFVGIGGLWFIPSFHHLTKLSPFLGALCVLAVLWIVNEIFNRKLVVSDITVLHKTPWVLQYGVIQMMLFVMGVMLMIGVAEETGAVHWFISQSGIYIRNAWAMGLTAGLVSSFFDNFATAISFFSLSPVDSISHIGEVNQNDSYWMIIAFTSSVGGNLLCIGSISGMAYMKMERVKLGWFFKNVTWMSFLGMVLGILVMYALI